MQLLNRLIARVKAFFAKEVVTEVKPISDTKFQQYPETVHDRIRELAYYMWESSGKPEGREWDFWFDAETIVLCQLREEMAKTQREAKDANH